jgi:hypothetical protein
LCRSTPTLWFRCEKTGVALDQGALKLKYKPRPIDVSEVELSPEILALTERLAESTHDTWALKRMHEGWEHGPARDDVAKTHPCLVPYDKLPESEKEYDRQTAIQTLKAIVALGYRIKKAH